MKGEKRRERIYVKKMQEKEGHNNKIMIGNKAKDRRKKKEIMDDEKLKRRQGRNKKNEA